MSSYGDYGRPIYSVNPAVIVVTGTDYRLESPQNTWANRL